MELKFVSTVKVTVTCHVLTDLTGFYILLMYFAGPKQEAVEPEPPVPQREESVSKQPPPQVDSQAHTQRIEDGMPTDCTHLKLQQKATTK